MLERQISLCSELRRNSIKAIIETVNELREGITTEREALDILIKSLRNHQVTDYWYPVGEAKGSKQFGCIVAFDTKSSKKRTAFPNARTLISSEKIRWEGLGYFYVSPQRLTQRGEIIWGDFGSSVYTKESQVIKSFFIKSWNLSEKLLSVVSQSKNSTTGELFKAYQSFARTLGIKNIAMSKVGPTIGASNFNIGHSFPWISGVKASQVTPQFMNFLHQKRIFIDSSSNIPLQGKIWSLESRDHARGYPYGTISFHRLFAIKETSFIKLPDHNEFFDAIGMNWIYERRDKCE